MFRITMNAKAVFGVIAAIVIAIGIAVLVSFSNTPSDIQTEENSLDIEIKESLNIQEEQNTTAGKHFSIELSENVGIASSP